MQSMGLTSLVRDYDDSTLLAAIGKTPKFLSRKCEQIEWLTGGQPNGLPIDQLSRLQMTEMKIKALKIISEQLETIADLFGVHLTFSEMQHRENIIVILRRIDKIGSLVRRHLYANDPLYVDERKNSLMRWSFFQLCESLDLAASRGNQESDIEKVEYAYNVFTDEIREKFYMRRRAIKISDNDHDCDVWSFNDTYKLIRETRRFLSAMIRGYQEKTNPEKLQILQRLEIAKQEIENNYLEFNKACQFHHYDGSQRIQRIALVGLSSIEAIIGVLQELRGNLKGDRSTFLRRLPFYPLDESKKIVIVRQQLKELQEEFLRCIDAHQNLAISEEYFGDDALYDCGIGTRKEKKTDVEKKASDTLSQAEICQVLENPNLELSEKTIYLFLKTEEFIYIQDAFYEKCAIGPDDRILGIFKAAGIQWNACHEMLNATIQNLLHADDDLILMTTQDTIDCIATMGSLVTELENRVDAIVIAVEEPYFNAFQIMQEKIRRLRMEFDWCLGLHQELLFQQGRPRKTASTQKDAHSAIVHLDLSLREQRNLSSLNKKRSLKAAFKSGANKRMLAAEIEPEFLRKENKSSEGNGAVFLDLDERMSAFETRLEPIMV